MRDYGWPIFFALSVVNDDEDYAGGVAEAQPTDQQITLGLSASEQLNEFVKDCDRPNGEFQQAGLTTGRPGQPL
jgi:hypothetical protein